jgi:hypothetical protein
MCSDPLTGSNKNWLKYRPGWLVIMHDHHQFFQNKLINVSWISQLYGNPQPTSTVTTFPTSNRLCNLRYLRVGCVPFPWGNPPTSWVYGRKKSKQLTFHLFSTWNRDNREQDLHPIQENVPLRGGRMGSHVRFHNIHQPSGFVRSPVSKGLWLLLYA